MLFQFETSLTTLHTLITNNTDENTVWVIYPNSDSDDDVKL